MDFILKRQRKCARKKRKDRKNLKGRRKRNKESLRKEVTGKEVSKFMYHALTAQRVRNHRNLSKILSIRKKVGFLVNNQLEVQLI